MAIAVVPDYQPLPSRPSLRLVRSPDLAAEGPGPGGRTTPSPHGLGPSSSGVRRRRLGLAVATVVLLTGLALPVGALGGRSTTGAGSDLPASEVAGLIDGGSGVVYVVRPGDSLRSIAAVMDPSDPRRPRGPPGPADRFTDGGPR